MEKKSWLKVVITTDFRLRDALSDFLVGILGAGVELAAPGEPGCDTVTAWLEIAAPAEREQVLARIGRHLSELRKIFGTAEAQLSWEMLEDQDWSASWKKHFHPFAIIKELVIVPGWERYLPKKGEQIVVMDPGMAFGTGHHDTTKFSLECIRDVLGQGKRCSVLDVGTGTGILGMGAALLGAERVVAIDNDPDAVAAAEKNIIRNGLKEKMEVSLTPLAALEEEFSLVVANIIHDVLAGMADDLVARTAPAGSLVLSGLLKGEQTEHMKDVFTARGLLLEASREGDEWAALWLKKGV